MSYAPKPLNDDVPERTYPSVSAGTGLADGQFGLFSNTEVLKCIVEAVECTKDTQTEKDQKLPYSISTRCDKDNRTRCQYQAAGFVAAS